ncbi:MAG: membrane protein insertion efficiency factor YidD [Bacteroidota bacterium]|nr:membrane protein insertion efficiency factor YidD [bacterium]NBP64162.1 membrane protein insertion efficiency factor YidD [Bacteroidota bacterium]
MKFVLMMILRFYRSAISPYLGNNCRFHPTCSVYAMQAIEQYGSIKGTWLALKRIVKCHPWHPGGIDEVP